MPTLIHILQKQDMGFIRIVARFWGIELAASDLQAASLELSRAILAPPLVAETIRALPAEAKGALAHLLSSGGRLPWAAFTRKYGELRAAGAAKRDREHLHLQDGSAVEFLYYRALLSTGFFDSADGPLECAYIPDEMMVILPSAGLPALPGYLHKEEGVSTPPGEGRSMELGLESVGRPAANYECQHPLPASDEILDDATTFLAAHRCGVALPQTGIPSGVLEDFLTAAGIIRNGEPQPEPVRKFLESSREVALQQLVAGWHESATFNELTQIPGISVEGVGLNNPLAARRYLLACLAMIPPGKWWSLQSFIQGVKTRKPDFQRPAGDYDSWFIKRDSDGTYLRGFDTWDEVDGALIRHLVCGPLFWLRQVDLATLSGGQGVSAFRIIPGILHPSTRVEPGEKTEAARAGVSSQGRIVLPVHFPRAVRYQVSRFCEWGASRGAEFTYHISTRSMERARQQGLKTTQLLQLLARNSAAEIPPSLVKALQRWELKGTEARVETKHILKVNRPEILTELRKSKAARFLEESLGPTTVVVKPGAKARVQAVMLEMGYLVDDAADES